VITVAGIVLSAGCGRDKSPAKPQLDQPLPCGDLLIVTTDFSTGSIGVVCADSTVQTFNDLEAVHSDAVARVHGGLVYVLNRFGGDNVQVLDPARRFRTIRQYSVGVGSNPHDIAFVAEDRAYVSRNGSASLLEIDPRTGARRDSISLAPLADSDGIPDMDRIFLQDPYLYIEVQRIDFGGGTYAPVPPSYLAVVDTRTNALVDVDPAQDGLQGIVLAGTNPDAPMVWDAASSLLLVPEVGVRGQLDAGVEKVDLAVWRSAGWLVREEQLGGDLVDFSRTAGEKGYAVILLSDNSTALVAFDEASGARLSTIYASSAYALVDVQATASGLLFVCDRDYAAPGLRVFRRDTGLAVTGIPQPVGTGLPPFELVPLGE
jgi:hypothetical protein